MSCNGLNPSQGVDVGVMNHVVLDLVRETLIKLVPESGIPQLGENC
jgi:hypothetical protein